MLFCCAKIPPSVCIMKYLSLEETIALPVIFVSFILLDDMLRTIYRNICSFLPYSKTVAKQNECT